MLRSAGKTGEIRESGELGGGVAGRNVKGYPAEISDIQPTPSCTFCADCVKNFLQGMIGELPVRRNEAGCEGESIMSSGRVSREIEGSAGGLEQARIAEDPMGLGGYGRTIY